MEIRDPVHGSIPIADEEIPIIGHRYFQRLRNVKQLGFSEFAFPGATHTRFLHSIGVLSIATKAFDRLFHDRLQNRDIQRLRETVRLAGLLHDIGHAPLSHTTESVMPSLRSLQLPERFTHGENLERQATHEDYTVKAIVDGRLAESFKAVENRYGVERHAIAELILGDTRDSDYFLVDGIDHFPILHQLISSEVDADRMDYLLRDSYFCGVSYGHYDLDWIIDNLIPCEMNGQWLLGISERAVTTFDDFLLSRFHMFIMVYFHYRSVCLEQMLHRYFSTAQGEYTIPSDIEAYQEHDDHFLMKVLRTSSNPWAQKIVRNEIPQKVFETFGEGQLDKVDRLEHFLLNHSIDYIRSSSLGRLSKYYGREKESKVLYPMQMARTFHGTKRKSFTNIQDATGLFEKFSHAHSVNRIHCEMEHLTLEQQDAIHRIIQDVDV